MEGKQDANDLLQAMSVGDHEGAKQIFDRWMQTSKRSENQEQQSLPTPSVDERTSTSAELKVEVKAPKTEGKRAKHKCPVPNCPKEYVVHLPRHLRDFHKWSNEKAAQAISQFNLRKPRKRKIVEKSREHQRRVCPVDGCNAVVKRIHNHLRGKHKLTPEDTRYQAYLKEKLYELPETFEEEIISISSGSISEDSTEEKSKITRVDSVLEEAIGEEKRGKKGKKTENELANEPANVSPLELLWEQFFGRKGEASDESSHDDVTPQGYNTAVKKQSDAPLWNASKTPLSEKEKSLIRPPNDTPHLSHFVYLDSDSEYISESTSGEEDSIVESASSDRGEFEHIKNSDSLCISKASKNAASDRSDEEASDGGERESSDISPSTSKRFGETSCGSDSHENSDSQVGDAHAPLFDDELHGVSDQLLEETSNDKWTEDALDKFFKWLTGIDGGRREEKTAKQYVSQVRSIVKKVDPEYHRVNSLVSTRLVRDNWLDPLEKSRRPGTCKSYLGSLSKFFRFVMVEKPSGLNVKFEAVRAAKEQVHEWMSSYNKPIARRMWEKKAADIDRLITPEQIRAFDVSEPARTAVKLIENYSATPDENSYPSQSEYTIVRDFFLTTLCINNAARAGPLANFTIGEYRNAKQEGEQYVARVLNHKTLESHGPASLVISANLYTWLAIFIRKMRYSLQGVSSTAEDRVFVSWTGKAMTSSMVSAQINSFWSKALGKGAERMSATLIRKTAVSAVHERQGSMKKNLVNLMTHSEKTADKYYNIQQKGKNDAKTVEQLRTVLRSSSASEVSVLNTGENTSNVSSRHKWNEEQLTEVYTAFKESIQSGQVTMECVREVIADNAVLKNIPLTSIRDKVKSLIKASQETQSLSNGAGAQPPTQVETPFEKLRRFGLLPDEIGETRQQNDPKDIRFVDDASAKTNTRTSLKSGRAFDDEQTQTLSRLFKHLIETNAPIERPAVMRTIEGDARASVILRQFTPLQLCDKIRTERKRIRRLWKRK